MKINVYCQDRTLHGGYIAYYIGEKPGHIPDGCLAAEPEGTFATMDDAEEFIRKEAERLKRDYGMDADHDFRSPEGYDRNMMRVFSQPDEDEDYDFWNNSDYANSRMDEGKHK